MNSIIYPSVEFRESINALTIHSYLRKQGKDNKWYKILFSSTMYKAPDALRHEMEISLLMKLHDAVYHFIICGIVDTEGKLLLEDDTTWCTLDKNQFREEVRIYAQMYNVTIEQAEKILTKEPDYPLNYYMNYE